LHKRVLLKDIAEKTGFSINAVSRALRNKDDISVKTKSIILKAAKSMGYIADMTASSMRSKKTNTIAVIICDIANPFFCYILRDLELAAKESGLAVIIFNTGENSEREKEAVLSAYSRKVDGIIICPVQENTDNIKLLQKLSIPFVLMGRYFDNLNVDAVHWDDVKAGELAADYLFDRGHTNILFVGAPLNISNARDRLQGYRNAFERRKLPIREDMICIAGVMAGKVKDAIFNIMENGPAFTAAIAYSDLLAYEILYSLQKNHLKNIEVVGFDNLQGKLMLPLNFPSVNSLYDGARTSVELLINRINKRNSEPKTIVLDVEATNIQQP